MSMNAVFDSLERLYYARDNTAEVGNCVYIHE